MRAKEMPAQQSRSRILVADDIDFNRDFIGAILTAADFDVDVVCDGFAVCEAAAKSSYDLILMDIEMPGMDGFEAAARIRAGDLVVPIAALTSTGRLQARELSERSGMDAFIARPIEPRLLVRQISRMLADRSGPGDAIKKRTWRFSTFSDLSTRLGSERMDAHLLCFAASLASMAFSIADGFETLDGFYKRVQDLLSVSGMLGFERVSSLCSEIQAEQNDVTKLDRSHDLSMAVTAAVDAIAEYQRNKTLASKQYRTDRPCLE